MKKSIPFLKLAGFGCDAKCFGCDRHYTMEGMPTMHTMATICFLLDIEYDILLHMEVDVDVSRLLLEQGSIG